MWKQAQYPKGHIVTISLIQKKEGKRHFWKLLKLSNYKTMGQQTLYDENIKFNRKKSERTHAQ